MSPEGWSVIIKASGIALAAVITALMPYLIHKLNVVHKLVNSAHDALVNYVGVLTTAMASAGVTIPQPAEGAVTGGAEAAKTEADGAPQS